MSNHSCVAGGAAGGEAPGLGVPVCGRDPRRTRCSRGQLCGAPRALAVPGPWTRALLVGLWLRCVTAATAVMQTGGAQTWLQ